LSDFVTTVCFICATVMCRHVYVMCLSCDCHVTVICMSCDRHVTIMWPSCDHHVCIMWPSCCVMWPSCVCHVNVMWPSCVCHVTVMRVSCDCHVTCFLVVWPWFLRRTETHQPCHSEPHNIPTRTCVASLSVELLHVAQSQSLTNHEKVKIDHNKCSNHCVTANNLHASQSYAH